MWIEVFKAGTWTDASGKTREWSIHDIDRIIDNYDVELNEAPLVLGHPEDDSPAYGWVEAIKRVGDTMLVKPKEMVEKFTNWVKDKHYKKVSIAINGDLSLRHVGFLGGTPPAVKGLKAPEFSVSEFSQYDIEAVELHEVDNPNIQEDGMKKEIETLKAELAQKETEVEEYKTKFQEGDEERDKAIKELSAIRLQIRKMEFEQFLSEETVFEALTQEQRGAALQILNALDGVNFSEADGETETPVQKFQSFLRTLPARVEKKEIAKKDDADKEKEITGASKFTNGEKNIEVTEQSLAFHAKIMGRAKEKNITFSEALDEIREEASNG